MQVQNELFVFVGLPAVLWYLLVFFVNGDGAGGDFF